VTPNVVTFSAAINACETGNQNSLDLSLHLLDFMVGSKLNEEDTPIPAGVSLPVQKQTN